MCWTLPSREKTAFPIFEKVAASFTEVKPTGGAPSEAPKEADAGQIIRQIVIEHLGVEKAKVVPTARLKEDLGADELDLVELVMAVEEEFSISIPDEEAMKWHTLQDMLRTAGGQ